MDTYNLPSETGRFISEVKNLSGWTGCKADESKSLFSSVERDITRLIKYLETNSSSIKIMEEQLDLVKKENAQLSKEILDQQVSMFYINPTILFSLIQTSWELFS